MAHAGPPERRSLVERLDRWTFGASATSVVVALALGGVQAALGVAAVAGVAVWRLRAGLRADLEPFDALVEAVDADRETPRELPGDAGRVARASAGREEVSRRAYERSRRALERVFATFDAAPWGVLVIGADGRIELANKAMNQLLDFRREAIGARIVELLPPAELLAVLDDALAGREGGPLDFVQGERDLAVSAHPAGDAVLVLVRDVSGERRLDRARTEFVANVSHELRTPIAAILGYAETLLDTPGGLPDDMAPLVRTIHRNGKRLRQLFEDLLSLYTIEARREEMPRDDVELSSVVPLAVVTAADAARTKKIAFFVDVPPELHAFTSREALSAVLGNLADNATKYTPEGGSVAVVAERVEDGVRIDVRDTGIGIPKAYQERVFERFYRVDEGRSRALGGTGLGLAIVKHLAMAGGFRVTVTSEEGKGSTFSVWIPAAVTPRVSRTWQA